MNRNAAAEAMHAKHWQAIMTVGPDILCASSFAVSALQTVSTLTDALEVISRSEDDAEIVPKLADIVHRMAGSAARIAEEWSDLERCECREAPNGPPQGRDCPVHPAPEARQ